ncbi:MAG: LysE family translocator [Actinomycetota bacterium]|nr:LysE family translocator [Actinomycetota bacterium]
MASQILPFVLVTIPVLLMPGPDLLLVLRNSAIGGRHGGAATAAGTVAGLLVHATGAALGLSALLAASAEAFTVVKLIGAGYLLYMGVQSLRAAAARAHDVGAGLTGTAAEQLGRQAFRQGLLTNVLNPKIAAFFLAFLPQFVTPATSATAQTALLGAIFITMSVVWLAAVVRGASAASRLLSRDSVRRRLDAVAGVVFLGFAGRLALARS